MHKQALTNLIGKYEVIFRTGYRIAIDRSLRPLMGSLDSLSFGIIGSVPNCAPGALQDKNQLDASLQEAITKYSG
jgi:hypothetical protein